MRVRSCARPRRGGFTLVELLVALPLAMLAAAAAGLLLVRLGRTARAQSAALAGVREQRHARALLSADLEPIAGAQLTVVSDTLIAFRSQVGVALLCGTSDPYTLQVGVPDDASDAWVPSLRRGDLASLWQVAPEPSSPPTPQIIRVAGAPTSLGMAPCATDTTLARRWHVPVSDSISRAMRGPLAWYREVRYRHYRSGTSWWLGRQTFDGRQWDGVQPVAGPFLGAVEHGLQMEARDVAGAPVTITEATPDSVRQRAVLLAITLRAPRRVRERWAPALDSSVLVIPLRGTMPRRLP